MSMNAKGYIAVLSSASAVLDLAKWYFLFWHKVRGSRFLARTPLILWPPMFESQIRTFSLLENTNPRGLNFGRFARSDLAHFLASAPRGD